MRRIAALFRDFTPAHLDRLGEVYTGDFEFRDPFGAIRGDLPALREHFAKLFELHESRFEVHDGATGTDGSYLRWTWTWQWRSWSRRKSVPGIAHLRFAAGGRLRFHQDHFDAADGFYDTLPGVGAVLRTIRRRLEPDVMPLTVRLTDKGA